VYRSEVQDESERADAYSLLMTMLGWLSMTPSDSSRVAITPKVETDGRGELQLSLEAA